MATVVDLLNWHKLVHLFMRPEGVHCLTVQKSTGWREEGVPDSGRPVFHFSVPLAWGEEWDQSMMGVGWRQHCCGLCREGSEGPGTFPAVFTLCRCLQSTTEQLPINTIAGQEAFQQCSSRSCWGWHAKCWHGCGPRGIWSSPLHFRLPDQQWLMGSPLLLHVHFHHLLRRSEIVALTPCHQTSLM